ncbi:MULTISPECIES: DUF5677 domain-containing protein [Oceanobacillus]|uniref:Uncharacterized protein n=1 Tax=Oceanobacillus neutriphilus TaxID=531815 RepID=A0ABQ2NRJ5_9BACI|nr:MULTISPECIES: DUF5677 domain-containing protein [Oceanobacillus]GGP08802.1 hypothetical protein GCM10011346_10570 [Oceanobacillus neutriphilus]
MADYTNEFLQDTFMKLLEEQLEKAKTQEEADEIIKKFEEVDLDKIFKDMYTRMANDTTGYMRDTMYEQVMLFRAEEQEFLSIQEQKWNKAFVASESMYIMVIEAAQSYVEHVNNLPQDQLQESSHVFTAMQHIHGRAMQQFLEIITLMKNGFADGAYARWRSMYELAIISSFIKEHGEPVAKAFIQSSNTEDRYEWARTSGVFPTIKRFISFNDIQKNCDINSTVWRRQYDLANKIVHASPQGTFARLSNMTPKDVIPSGRSDFGITTPAEHSAISLAQITTMFLTIHPSGDSLVAIKYIQNWIDIIREIYFKTHDLIFPEEEKLWDESMTSYEDEVNKGN